MKDTAQRNQLVMSVIAIVIGLLMAYVVPFIIQTSLDRVLVHLLAHIEAGNPTFSSGPKLFDFFFPVWRAVIFVAGVALIIISRAVRRGEPWTFPLSIALFALPSIGGMFMFLPYISFVGGFPLPMVTSWIGLAGFWSFIFLQPTPRAQKWARFGALTFIGMLSTHAFTIGVGAQRTMWTRPGYPLYPDFTWWLFNWVGEVNWVAVILLFLSIPLIAAGKREGWWFVTIATTAILMINIPTQFFRTKTLDYLYGALLAVGVLIFTQLPYFKRNLFGENTPST
jgi:hypothetical protein